jgi:hypothetical protein
MSDIASFTLRPILAEGTLAVEPEAGISFMRTDNVAILSAHHVAFPPARIFRIPSWPTVGALYCDVSFSLYRPIKSAFFFPMTNAPQDCRVFAIRDPGKWTPKFVRLDALPSDRFSSFQKVVAKSDEVALKHGSAIGRLQDAYGDLQDLGDQAVLSKTCLLNLYAVLTDEVDPISNKSWFSFVRKFIRLDKERFVAEIDVTLHETVKSVLSELDRYKDRGFFTESASLHYDNIPGDYQIKSDLITIKVRYEQGNIQLTTCKAIKGGNDVYLLDCDMDEHSNIIAHTADLFQHIFTGGTHPIDMHEYIVFHSARQNDGAANIALDYDLVPSDARISPPTLLESSSPA